MAEAAGADHAFFSTCGSSLSVKAAMLAVAVAVAVAVAGADADLLLGRDAQPAARRQPPPGVVRAASAD
jgi:arginine decarboxylase